MKTLKLMKTFTELQRLSAEIKTGESNVNMLLIMQWFKKQILCRWTFFELKTMGRVVGLGLFN